MPPKLHRPKHLQQTREPHPPTIPEFLVYSKAVEEVSLEPLAVSTLTSKGQVTIPQAIRSMYHLDTGDSLVWRRDKEGRLVVEPRRTLTLSDIRAAIAAAGAPVPPRAFTNEEMDEATGQALEAKYGRH